MSAAAITARLRQVSHALAERGPARKGVDMSPAAVTARLKTVAQLSNMCRRLGAAGKLMRERERSPSGK